nr:MULTISPECIES: hypothetical protein [unclassified Microcoleus]
MSVLFGTVFIAAAVALA